MIALSATFTIEPVRESLEFWIRFLRWDFEVRFAPYNQVFQQLLDPGGLIARNSGGINAVLVRLEDWQAAGNGADLEGVARRFVDAARQASLHAPLIALVCPPSPSRRADAALASAEEQIRKGLAESAGVHLVLPAELERFYPFAAYHDPHAEQLGHVPYTRAGYAALATMLARKIHALRTPPYKVIALDCDDTLWRGVCGEDGPQGVEIDAPHRALQEFLEARKEEGMLLVLSSKNNEEDVLETFHAHPEMPLRLEDFAARRINWDSKSAGLLEMAEDLGLAPDSFILVDDNPKECLEVRSCCPDVLAIPLPPGCADPAGYLRRVWAFDRTRVTSEDRQRTALYAQQVERARLARTSASLEEFLRSLALEIEIAPAAPANLPRIAQLSQRTNQMNLTVVRRTESELERLLGAGAECLVVRVRDRFGDYGLTGAVIFSARGEALAVDTFLLSCRALGRGVEHRMVAELGRIAGQRHLSAVELSYRPSQRNRPGLLFLESVAAAFGTREGDARMFRLPAAYAAQVTYRPSEKRIETVPARGTGKPETDPERPDYLRIAAELSTPEKVLEAVREAHLAGFERREPPVAPRTPLEKELAALWAELLRVPAVGVEDSFFDLGGHSLLAVHLLARVREKYGVDVSLEVVYGPTFNVAELARAIELKEIENAGDIGELLAEVEGLSDEEIRAMLSRAEEAGAD